MFFKDLLVHGGPRGYRDNIWSTVWFSWPQSQFRLCVKSHLTYYQRDLTQLQVKINKCVSFVFERLDSDSDYSSFVYQTDNVTEIRKQIVNMIWL